MKTKKLELKELPSDKKKTGPQYLYINGKIVKDIPFLYDEYYKITINEVQFKMADIKKIFACSYDDIPDNTMLGAFYDYKSRTGISYLCSIERKGKKIIVEFQMGTANMKKKFLWNSYDFLREMERRLKYVEFVKQPNAMDAESDDAHCQTYIIMFQPKLTDNIGYSINNGFNLIEIFAETLQLELLKQATEEIEKSGTVISFMKKK